MLLFVHMLIVCTRACVCPLWGATTPQEVKRAELIQWIRDAGRTPVERDPLYNVVWEEPELAEV